ncbi:MAG: hypothetical protein ACYSSI_06965 [Planctomycetota bacterium]|jgi:hypothetical protein
MPSTYGLVLVQNKKVGDRIFSVILTAYLLGGGTAVTGIPATANNAANSCFHTAVRPLKSENIPRRKQVLIILAEADG